MVSWAIWARCYWTSWCFFWWWPPWFRRCGAQSSRALIMRLVSRTLPRMGDTERIALEAGTVWWDGDLFSGNPDWTKLLRFKPVGLTAKEQAFIDGPVAELCAMLDEWQIENDKDLPPEVWRFIKSKGFFGMIIPEAYGGLGFSAAAHSAVVVKLSSRSLTAAVTVMVPNSLGPAELLLHYGTDAQKSHYLPRLAAAEEIPCFALTGPEAGSDAAATTSEGVVCRGTWQGREVARDPPELAQALHHAGADRDAHRPGVPAARSRRAARARPGRAAARPRRRPRDHLRAGPGQSARHHHRAAARPAGHPVPERPDRGARRVRSASTRSSAAPPTPATAGGC